MQPILHLKIAALAILFVLVFVLVSWQSPLVSLGNEGPSPLETDQKTPTLPDSAGDTSSPDVSNPDVSSPEVSNPEASNPESSPTFTTMNPPPELHWLTPGILPPEHLITSTTISLSGLTPPSLWWTDQQFGGKILDGWIAYPGTDTLPPRVDLVVNRQLWGLSDYLERYSFVHHFGQAAQEFGYSIRVFNDVGDALAIYPCPPTPSCSIIVDSSGLGVLRDNDPFSSF